MVERQRLASKPTEREREMRAVLRELDRSGLGLAEFGRQRGISPGTLSWWRHVVRRRTRAEGKAPIDGPARFVEVVVDANPATISVFEVVLRGGATVRVPASFDGSALRRLITTLEAAC